MGRTWQTRTTSASADPSDCHLGLLEGLFPACVVGLGRLAPAVSDFDEEFFVYKNDTIATTPTSFSLT